MDTLSFISALEDLKTNAEPIRSKFVMGYKHFLPAKEDSKASQLLSLLCTEKISSTLTNHELGLIVEIIFQDSRIDFAWLSKYCDFLLCSLNHKKTKDHTDTIADKYEKYLREVLVEDFKKVIGNPKEKQKQEKVLELLCDIYKISSALYAYYTGLRFTMNVTRYDLEKMEITLRDKNNIIPPPGLQQFFSLLTQIRNEEQQYAIFLSWILIEMVCDQDGLD